MTGFPLRTTPWTLAIVLLAIGTGRWCRNRSGPCVHSSCLGPIPMIANWTQGCNGRAMGEAGAQGQVRLRDQRRHRPPRDGRRDSRAATRERGPECREDPGRRDRGSRQPRRRALADPGEPSWTITRKIREWQGRRRHRTPTQRLSSRSPLCTGILVQDAAFMVIVPSFCPDVPGAPQESGLPLYTEDDFQKPNLFRPDVGRFDRSGSENRRPRRSTPSNLNFDERNPWLAGYLHEVSKEL